MTASYQVRLDLRLTAGWSLDHEAVNRAVREDRAHGDGGFWTLADGAAIPVPRALGRAQRGAESFDGLWRPWALDVGIEFCSERMAAQFEKYLKSGSGHNFANRHFVEPA